MGMVPRPVARQRRRAQAHRGHAGKRGDALDESGVEGVGVVRPGVGARNRVGEREEVVRLEAEVDLEKALHAPPDQAGPHQQHQRQRDLRAHQRGAPGEAVLISWERSAQGYVELYRRARGRV